ncbi:hypothetical protein BH10PLA1_BH10PLA1_03210 [soil metagenome]
MRRITMIAAVIPMMMAAVAFGQAAKSLPQITATKHNFNADGYSWADGEICKPCHTPHNATVDANISTRLWNHKLTTANYTLHNGTTNATYDQALDRYSRLCMSCHDGTVALDAFGLATDGTPNAGTDTAGFKDKSAMLGTDLTNDHPVGLAAVYDGAVSYHAATVSTTNSSGVTTTKVGSLTLVNATVGGATVTVVGCSTCHNPHGKGATAGNPYKHLLVVDNTNSALCTSCHLK